MYQIDHKPKSLNLPVHKRETFTFLGKVLILSMSHWLEKKNVFKSRLILGYNY